MNDNIKPATNKDMDTHLSGSGTRSATVGLSSVLTAMGLVALVAIVGVGGKIAFDLSQIATLADETNATTIADAEAAQNRALQVEKLARLAVLVMTAEDSDRRAQALTQAEDLGSILAGANAETDDREIAQVMAIVREIAEAGDQMDELRAQIQDLLAKANRAIDQADDTLVATSDEATLNLTESIADIGTASADSLNYLQQDMATLASQNTAIQSLLLTLRDMAARLGETRAITVIEDLERPERSYNGLAKRLPPLVNAIPTGGDNEYLPQVVGEFAGLSDVFSIRRTQLDLAAQIKAMNDDATGILSAVTDRLSASAARGMRETVQGGHDIAVGARGIRTTGIVIFLGLLGFGSVVAWFLRGQVLKPVSHASRALEDMRQGRLDAEMPPTRLREFEAIRLSLEGFRQALLDTRRLEAEKAADRTAREDEADRVLKLCGEFDKTATDSLRAVSSSATEMQATAQQMSATAEETSRQSASVASSSEQATDNVQTVAATAEQLSASISEIGRQVMQSARIAQNAVDETEATNKTVQGLADAAAKIGEVVKLINDIAGQTNLLALNATIEAARAGEAGKGFAVVAQEVKNLANQTAKATEEISAQIGAVQEETQDAVVAIEKIRGIIGEVNDIATTISSAVEEQGVSTQEIARNVQQAAKGTQDVNDNIESVSKAAGETGTAPARCWARRRKCHARPRVLAARSRSSSPISAPPELSDNRTRLHGPSLGAARFSFGRRCVRTGQRFRLRDRNRGDMYIEAQVETPVNLTRRQPEHHGFFAKVKEFWDDLTE